MEKWEHIEVILRGALIAIFPAGRVDLAGAFQKIPNVKVRLYTENERNYAEIRKDSDLSHRTVLEFIENQGWEAFIVLGSSKWYFKRRTE